MATATATRTLDHYLSEVLERGATDLHVTAGSPPLVRIDGELAVLSDHAPLRPADVEKLVGGMLSGDQKQQFEERKTLDFSFDWQGRARFRANVFRQRGSAAIAIRHIPYDVPSFDELGLPPLVEDLAKLQQGLILVTGAAGSGKSSTLASMVAWISRDRPVHIITIEDPIEFVHRHDLAIVNQRELGDDTPTFVEALRSTLREDPDVILVGELRDLETIRSALTLAETGHLVMATLHTNDTAQAIDRLVDVFPAEQQTQIRIQLANSLEAVLYQRLVPKVGGGRAAAFEILLATSPVRNLIREGRTNQLRNVITTAVRDGMRTLEMDLSRLVREGTISVDDALARSLHPREIAS